MADIRFERATRIYPGTDVPAVDALDLHVADGELMVLVGPSGCGKTRGRATGTSQWCSRATRSTRT